MTFNLEMFLVWATAITGVVTFANWQMQRRRAGDEAPAESGLRYQFIEMCRSFFPVLAIVLFLRSFVFEPYKIPSSSMVPTLLIGDFIFVSKFSYGVRLPVIHAKIIETGEPERGDVAVFRLPADPSVNYIKRIIGLPGDRVEYTRGRLSVNGEEVPLTAQGHYSNGEESGMLYAELLGDQPHPLLHKNREFSRSFGPATVPPDAYFVMGDNRENSTDGRFPSVGYIPERNLVGRAGRIWFNFRWNQWPKWERIGDKIQ